MIDKSIVSFTEDVAARTSAPGGGSVCAVVIGMAAALTAMVARFSDDMLDEAFDLADKCDVLRNQVLPLAKADAEAYAALMAAWRTAREDPTAEDTTDEASLRAAEVPLEISAYGAEVAYIAARLAEHGNRNLSGDAVAAALIAAAATRAAADFVRINLDHQAEQYAVAADHVRNADAAAARALAATR